MQQPGTPDATSTAHARKRARAWLVAGGIAVAAFSGWLGVVSRDAVSALEARAVAGDYPVLRRETAPAVVDEFGRVAVGGLLREPPLSVASQRLTPPGAYVEILIANDGIPAHVKKTELVIGARDAAGVWHPASAAGVAARVVAGAPAQP